MKLRSFTKPGKSSSSGEKKKKKKFKFGKTPSHLKEARREGKPDREKKVASGDEDGADWATTDAAEIAGKIETNRHLSSQNRPPEFYMKDGEKKRIRFRSDEPIAGFYQYGCKLGGNFADFTQPRPGSVDLFQKKGLKPTLKVLYEIIDIDGYTDRQGARKRFVPKFWRVGTRINEQIAAILEQYGSLKNRVIVVTRRGQKTKTTYALLPEGRSKPDPKELAAERLKPKWRQFYAPPTPEVQKSIIGGVSDPNAEDDKDVIPF